MSGTGGARNVRHWHTMETLPTEEASGEFARCWAAAGQHLDQLTSGHDMAWMRAQLVPPYLEHLSFRIGNQLVFVRLEDVAGAIEVPGSRAELQRIAAACGGVACLMPMRRRVGRWEPAEPGWGLVDVQTGAPVHPPALPTNEPVEMSVWELQDLAVQVVRRALEREGREIISWQGDPDRHPAIWFNGDSGPEWVVVGFARYPRRDAYPPADLAAIAERCGRHARRGHLASVAFASAGEAEGGSEDGEPLPLLRGAPLMVAFAGLAEHNPDR